uniref:Uncharacterized protein n=1 Tax=Steinernema glaseri TaxID=37863 RepID=A0A1I7ZT79_9BILA
MIQFQLRERQETFRGRLKQTSTPTPSLQDRPQDPFCRFIVFEMHSPRAGTVVNHMTTVSRGGMKRHLLSPSGLTLISSFGNEFRAEASSICWCMNSRRLLPIDRRRTEVRETSSGNCQGRKESVIDRATNVSEHVGEETEGDLWYWDRAW